MDGGGKKLVKTPTTKTARMGVDKSNIIGKRSVKPPTVFVPTMPTGAKKTVADPAKEKRATLMPLYASVMKENPSVKLTSAERRKVLNAVIQEDVANAPTASDEMAESPTNRVIDAIRRNVHATVDAREQKRRKAFDEMDLEDLLAGLSMTSKPVHRTAKQQKTVVSSVAERAAAKERAAKQAAERAMRYQRREELRAKLEHLKASYGLDMDVDVIVTGMNDRNLNDALAMSEDDLLDAFRTLRFGGGKNARARKAASSRK